MCPNQNQYSSNYVLAAYNIKRQYKHDYCFWGFKIKSGLEFWQNDNSNNSFIPFYSSPSHVLRFFFHVEFSFFIVCLKVPVYRS